MDVKLIDSHIHLDWYNQKDQEMILSDLNSNRIEAVITVSSNKASAQDNLRLSNNYPSVYTAFGYHPEQELPEECEIHSLFNFIEKHSDKMIAIGEVGLPYYLQKQNNNLNTEAYKQLLETFIELAKRLGKPIVLHAVYDDAHTVCNLLEKHSIKKAHFHWFKGDKNVTERIKKNGFFISITPDVLYEKEIRQLVKHYPLTQIMVETDGPWQFAGPFENYLTQPKMLHKVIEEIAMIKKEKITETYKIIYDNTKRFYSL